MKCRNCDMKFFYPRPDSLNSQSVLRAPNAFCLLALLTAALIGQLSGAVFDFSPLTGFLDARYVSSGNRVDIISGPSSISVPSGPTQNVITNNGVVAWSSSVSGFGPATVYYYVFDPARNQWAFGTSPGPTFDLSVVDGVVAWSTASGTQCRVYDPARRNWISGGASGAVSGSQVLNKGGVVAWTTATTVHYQTYDPTRSGWRMGATPRPADATGNTFDLATDNGLVAWSFSTGINTSRVYYQIYDPQSGSWVGQSNNNGPTTSLTIQDSLLSWSSTGGNFFRGYNGPLSRWESNAPTPLAYFAVSTNAGNAPFQVMFIDMSLAARSWALNFGDGKSRNKQSTFHPYTNYGRFTATLTINAGESGESTYSRVILTDIVPPAGTLAINGNSGFATNRNVALSLTATDNSGTVTSMRFNNDSGDWSDWETFATTKAWALNTNNGVRTVSTQFRDVALNTSATVNATIQLDTSPLPIVSLVNTNAGEESGSITLLAVLDHTYSRPVVVNYATSNNTATAGQDFDAKSGTLTFPVNTRSASFTVNIRQDTLVELNEMFLIQFAAVSNVVAEAPGEVTILDDDLAVVSFAQTNYSAIESNGAAAITVRLSAASGRTVKVSYLATNGTATADLDYVPVGGELTFPPGITNQTFIVPLIDESLDEFPETVDLQLSSVVSAILSVATNTTLTIIDDDKPVIFFTQSSYPAYEPTNGSSLVRMNVRLSKPYGAEVNVECAVEGITASPGDDYDQPFSTIALRYLPGQTNKEISLVIRPDTAPEPQENIRLTLVDFAGGSPGPITTAHIVITDDDAPPFMANPVLSTNGQFSATFIGYPGQVFAVECSPNFTSWTQLVRLTNTTGTLNFSQPIPTNSVGQFYRTRLIP